MNVEFLESYSHVMLLNVFVGSPTAFWEPFNEEKINHAKCLGNKCDLLVYSSFL